MNPKGIWIYSPGHIGPCSLITDHWKNTFTKYPFHEFWNGYFSQDVIVVNDYIPKKHLYITNELIPAFFQGEPFLVRKKNWDSITIRPHTLIIKSPVRLSEAFERFSLEKIKEGLFQREYTLYTPK